MSVLSVCSRLKVEERSQEDSSQNTQPVQDGNASLFHLAVLCTNTELGVIVVPPLSRQWR